jgi:hypothetical protein
VAFDFKRYVIKVQGNREYLPVSARLIWFRSDHPDWGIVTTPIEINLHPETNRPPYAIFQAQIFNAEGRLMATATKMEDQRGFTDFIEKAETGSVGRALALCGYGTQFAPELEEGNRHADSAFPPENRRYENGGYASRPNVPQRNGQPERSPVMMNGNVRPAARPMAERPMAERPAERPIEHPVAEARPVTTSRPAPTPEPVGPMDDEFDALLNEPEIEAPAAPAKTPPQGKVAPPGATITRVREPEVEEPLPIDDDEESDPFFDEAEEPTPMKNRMGRTNGAKESVAKAENQCSVEGCSATLNAAQLTMSQNKFGKALCPTHQKEATAVPSGARRNGRGGTDTLL